MESMTPLQEEELDTECVLMATKSMGELTPTDKRFYRMLTEEANKAQRRVHTASTRKIRRKTVQEIYATLLKQGKVMGTSSKKSADKNSNTSSSVSSLKMNMPPPFSSSSSTSKSSASSSSRSGGGNGTGGSTPNPFGNNNTTTAFFHDPFQRLRDVLYDQRMTVSDFILALDTNRDGAVDVDEWVREISIYYT